MVRPGLYCSREFDVYERQDEREENNNPSNELAHDDPWSPWSNYYPASVIHPNFTDS